MISNMGGGSTHGVQPQEPALAAPSPSWDEIGSALRRTILGKDAQRPPGIYPLLKPPPDRQTWLPELAPSFPPALLEIRPSEIWKASPNAVSIGKMGAGLISACDVKGATLSAQNFPAVSNVLESIGNSAINFWAIYATNAAVAPRWNQPGSEQDVARWLGGRRSLEAALHASFEETPLEDGFQNPAEDVLKQALERHPVRGARWIRELALRPTDPDLGRDIIVSLSRLPKDLVSTWAVDLAREALSSPDVRVRFASVRALEAFGGPRAAQLLQRHAEDEGVTWLADYARRVVRDLSR